MNVVGLEDGYMMLSSEQVASKTTTAKLFEFDSPLPLKLNSVFLKFGPLKPV